MSSHLNKAMFAGVLVALFLSRAAYDAAAQQVPGPKGDLSLLRWPLPHGAGAYADIDGKRMWRYVVDQAEISRRYRDSGHPQFWGRLAGTSAERRSLPTGYAPRIPELQKLRGMAEGFGE